MGHRPCCIFFLHYCSAIYIWFSIDLNDFRGRETTNVAKVGNLSIMTSFQEWHQITTPFRDSFNVTLPPRYLHCEIVNPLDSSFRSASVEIIHHGTYVGLSRNYDGWLILSPNQCCPHCWFNLGAEYIWDPADQGWAMGLSFIISKSMTPCQWEWHCVDRSRATTNDLRRGERNFKHQESDNRFFQRNTIFQN